MDTKKIFLASSAELKGDREQFEIFINRRNKWLVEQGIFLELLIWEDFLDAMSQTRLQDEYNKAIRGCDLFVMLFCTKVGKYTAEEFETAFREFREHSRPLIWVYFKDIEISTGSANRSDLESLWAFKEKLDKLGHFWTAYRNIEGLREHFGNQLDKLAASGFFYPSPQRDPEGNSAAAMADRILPEAAAYQKLMARLNELDAQFVTARERSLKYPDDEGFRDDMIRISQAQKELRKQVDEMKAGILALAESIRVVSGSGGRLGKAREYFAQGDLAGTRESLDEKAMVTDLDALLEESRRIRQQSEENSQKLAEVSDEFLLLAQLTLVNYDLEDRIARTEALFNKSLAASRNRRTLFAYALFLQQQNRDAEAINVYEEALQLMLGGSIHESLPLTPEAARTVNNLAILHARHRQVEAAAREYNRIIGYFDTMESAHPGLYLADLARALNNLGALFLENDLPDRIGDELDRALAIRKELAAGDPATFRPAVAMTLANRGVLRRNLKDYDGAYADFTEALDITGELAKADPATYLPDLARTRIGMANLYDDAGQLQAAYAEYTGALAICRMLARVNPGAYSPFLAITAYNLAVFCQDKLDERKLAATFAREAIGHALPFREKIPKMAGIEETARKILYGS